jgi:glycosyltransferase involved in cell wall biosynthesis
MRSLVDVVPFGLPSEAPQRFGAGMRQRYGLASDDFVVVWGGGIWNWLDPLTPIRAMAELGRRRSDVKLVFPGLKHPNPAVGEMAMTTRAIELAEQLQLRDRLVFFNLDWVPYAERADYLLDADAGISAHFDHLEARFAFRTRMLDYIWAGLPIVCTEGDTLADRVRSQQLGCVVGYEHSGGIAAALAQLAGDEGLRCEIKERLAAIRPQLQWSEVVRPLERQIEQLTARRRRRESNAVVMTAAYYASVARGIRKAEGVAGVARAAVGTLRGSRHHK